jgi:hypothetical protein
VLACPSCGGRLRLIATVEDPAVVGKILPHLGLLHPADSPGPAPPSAAPGRGERQAREKRLPTPYVLSSSSSRTGRQGSCTAYPEPCRLGTRWGRAATTGDD